MIEENICTPDWEERIAALTAITEPKQDSEKAEIYVFIDIGTTADRVAAADKVIAKAVTNGRKRETHQWPYKLTTVTALEAEFFQVLTFDFLKQLQGKHIGGVQGIRLSVSDCTVEEYIRKDPFATDPRYIKWWLRDALSCFKNQLAERQWETMPLPNLRASHAVMDAQGFWKRVDDWLAEKGAIEVYPGHKTRHCGRGTGTIFWGVK